MEEIKTKFKTLDEANAENKKYENLFFEFANDKKELLKPYTDSIFDSIIALIKEIGEVPKLLTPPNTQQKEIVIGIRIAEKNPIEVYENDMISIMPSVIACENDGEIIVRGFGVTFNNKFGDFMNRPLIVTKESNPYIIMKLKETIQEYLLFHADNKYYARVSGSKRPRTSIYLEPRKYLSNTERRIREYDIANNWGEIPKKWREENM